MAASICLHRGWRGTEGAEKNLERCSWKSRPGATTGAALSLQAIFQLFLFYAPKIAGENRVTVGP